MWDTKCSDETKKLIRKKKMADASNNICDTMEFDRKDNTGGTPHKDQGRNEDARNNERKCSHSTI
jgi:hypothetical protein